MVGLGDPLWQPIAQIPSWFRVNCRNLPIYLDAPGIQNTYRGPCHGHPNQYDPSVDHDYSPVLYHSAQRDTFTIDYTAQCNTFTIDYTAQCNAFTVDYSPKCDSNPEHDSVTRLQPSVPVQQQLAQSFGDAFPFF